MKNKLTLTVNQHAEAIKQAVSKSILGFIEVGDRVTEANTQLGEDEFSSLFDKAGENYVGMGERQIYRFMSISKGQKKLLKFQDDLPTDVTQLDAISRMTEKDIKAGIAAEVITNGMNRGDITKWQNPKTEKPVETEFSGEKTIDVKTTIPIEETIDIKSEDVTEEPKQADPLFDAMLYVLGNTPLDRRIKFVLGFIKKWKIKIKDLNQ